MLKTMRAFLFKIIVITIRRQGLEEITPAVIPMGNKNRAVHREIVPL